MISHPLPIEKNGFISAYCSGRSFAILNFTIATRALHGSPMTENEARRFRQKTFEQLLAAERADLDCPRCKLRAEAARRWGWRWEMFPTYYEGKLAAEK